MGESCGCGHGREWHLLGYCAYVVEPGIFCSCMGFRTDKEDAILKAARDLRRKKIGFGEFNRIVDENS